MYIYIYIYIYIYKEREREREREGSLFMRHREEGREEGREGGRGQTEREFSGRVKRKTRLYQRGQRDDKRAQG